MGQDEILRAVVNRAIQAAAALDKRVTNTLQVVNLPHADGRDRLQGDRQAHSECVVRVKQSMTPESAIQLIHSALLAAFWISAPLLAIGLSVGILVNIFQVATSLQDNVFSTFPRLAAFLIGFSVLMPWMLKQWMAYMINLCGDIARYGH